MDLIERAAATIERFGMLPKGGEHVLVALSGGPDSTALLLALNHLKPKHDLTLHAVYFDHGLRPEETPAEMEYCKALCAEIGAGFHTRPIDARGAAEAGGLNLHEAARRLRYAALEALRAELGADRIALGHTLTDQVETFFMRILRGSGPSGLLGIPPVRHRIIRPLIETERADVEAFLAERGVTPMADSSNESDEYMRNKLRLRVMPLLLEMNPNLTGTVARTMDILAEEERYFFIQVNKTMMRLIPKKTERAIELFMGPLESMDKALLRRVLRRALDETEGLRGIGHVHVEEIIGLVKYGGPGDEVHLPRHIRAVRKYATMEITSEPPVMLDARAMEAEGIIELPEAGRRIRATIIGEPPVPEPDGRMRCVLDAALAPFPLNVRARKHGDRMQPGGFHGHSRKVKEILIDAKVPRSERDAVPIITSGDEIVWVAGYRGDERFRPREGCTKFLLLELL